MKFSQNTEFLLERKCITFETLIFLKSTEFISFFDIDNKIIQSMSILILFAQIGRCNAFISFTRKSRCAVITHTSQCITSILFVVKCKFQPAFFVESTYFYYTSINVSDMSRRYIIYY